ncbi:MAG: sugar transferase [Gemmatimonadota bacterium]|nr:sugar transferase [Gemmatimonadota bacterium]
MTAVPRLDDLVLAAIADVDEHLHDVRWQLRVKRGADVVLSLALLVGLSPLLLLTALCIRAESRGAALFFQSRWGRKERVFRCAKFRSMRQHVSDGGASAATEGSLLKMRNDPRVTRIGRVIRRTSIDELPQLWNVLRGDMSLVGPRPLVLHMLQAYPDVRALRCRVRPGITGLWQVNARANNTHVADMLPYDTEYLRTVSLGLDLRLLVRTIRSVLSGTGAH